MKHDPSAAPDTAQNTALLVRADKLKLLFNQSFPALFISLFVALVFCWVLWGGGDNIWLMIWFALLFVSTLFRLAMFILYFRAKPSGLELLKWERPYIATLMFSSLIWGVGSLLMLPNASLVEQAFMFFVLMGLAGGAISTYSAQRAMALAPMAAILLPGTAWLYTQQDRIHTGMAIGTTLFMLAALRAIRVMGKAMHRSFQLTHELKQAHDTAAYLARTDALTGINNRRAFLEHGTRLINYCRRYEHQICAILFDVDRFKDINDQYGHGAGDSVLQQLGELLQKQLRESDVCGRIGGEEFAILLHPASAEDGRAVAEKLRQTIAEMPIAFRGQQLWITVSVGVACGAYDLESLLLKADAAMYQAKAEGRNRVTWHK
jgi:diguanylate cyclase (GGDEF)-like protein